MSVIKTIVPAAYAGHRPDVMSLVPLDVTSILDVGCSTGNLGAAVKARQECHFVGLDGSRCAIDEAQKKLDTALLVDLDQTEWVAQLNGKEFDCVIFADVLEHLKDPEALFQNLRPMLSPNCSVIVSLPNVRHISTFTRLLLGRRWPREPRGVHDRTHLRWFTDLDAQEILESWNVQIEIVKHNYRILEKPSRFNSTKVARLIYRLRPSLLIHQTLLRGRMHPPL